MWRTDSFKRPWCWERLKAEGEGDDRGWDGWKASLTRWMCVWVSSGSWWWIGKPVAIHGVTKSQTRLCDWNELNWIYSHYYIVLTSGASQWALVVKNLPTSVGVIREAGLIPGLGRFPGGAHGNPLQYSCLENPTDRGVWQAKAI